MGFLHETKKEVLFVYNHNIIKRRAIKMKINEYNYYNKLANWSFNNINRIEEIFTNWIYEEKIQEHTNEFSKILDLGTAAGEKVLKNFPDCAEILGTDFFN